MALSGDMVRSKSGAIFANLLHQAGVPFSYEGPLYAEDGTFFLPDFRLRIGGEKYYWEHCGMLFDKGYAAHRNLKKQWYMTHFPSRLIETLESGQLSSEAKSQIDEIRLK